MNVLPTAAFNSKASLLPSAAKKELSLRITELSNQTDAEALLANPDKFGIVKGLSTEDVYVMRLSEDYRLFFSLGHDNQGDYVLLLDIISQNAGLAPRSNANKNPKLNSMINPRVNSMINPQSNGMINPQSNGMINPRVNSMINPRVNSMINPRVNSMINPQSNGMINPRVNSMINPRVNSFINPTTNPNFDGLMLYDLNANPVGFLIIANEKVRLRFNNSLAYVGPVISNGADGWNIFDENNEWIGQLIRNGASGFNQFSTDNIWQGFAV